MHLSPIKPQLGVAQGVDLTGIVKRAGGVNIETCVHHHRCCMPTMHCELFPGVQTTPKLHTSCAVSAALHPTPASASGGIAKAAQHLLCAACRHPVAAAVRQLEAAVAALPAAGAVNTGLPAALAALLDALPPGDVDALAGGHARARTGQTFPVHADFGRSC